MAKQILHTQAMLIMTSIIRVGQSQFVTSPIDEDSYDRIMQDLHVVENIPNDRLMEKVYLKDTKAAFAKQVQAEDKRLADKKSKEDTSVTVQADDAIMFRQFTKKTGADSGDEVSKLWKFSMSKTDLGSKQSLTCSISMTWICLALLV